MPDLVPVRIEPVLAAGNIVGESALWSAGEQALYWVDIVGGHIARWSPATGRHDIWQAPEMPTSIGLCRSGRFIVGLTRRVTLWEPGGDFVTLAVPEPDRPANRLNEGVVAPDGSFWIGTMANNIGPDGDPTPIKESSGSLYRIDAAGVVTRLSDRRFGITNTMIWREDGRFLTADTLSDKYIVFRLSSDGLCLTDDTELAMPRLPGLPDGSVAVADGRVVSARVTGGGLAVLSADFERADFVPLPCAGPTSCAFGGPNLDILFVTSARFGMGPAELEGNTTDGALFAVHGLGRGSVSNRFADRL